MSDQEIDHSSVNIDALICKAGKQSINEELLFHWVVEVEVVIKAGEGQVLPLFFFSLDILIQSHSCFNHAFFGLDGMNLDLEP